MSPGGINRSSILFGNSWFTQQRDPERLGELTVVPPALDEAEPGNRGGISSSFTELRLGLQQDSAGGGAT